MTVVYESSQRGWTPSNHSTACLEERYEVIKEVGDGSFGSVSLARVRGASAHIARRGTMVAVKTMKKTFDSFSHCLELREVIFLRSLPSHPHLVPALDVFLDPYTKKLHIAMEYMDGNLYQLMKARDRKHLDGPSVKSILFQIMSGLEHIHAHNFFHRDIKPENILVSTSAPQDSTSAFKRYSALVTPPSTPPAYTIKIADFGLARETYSKLPYTTYVSTRWYRAPEVLLRAGEYSAPVDIWAVGAMAVEIATLKPLFPGSNEVDQVWRVCEIMGSPGNWVTKSATKVGGGEWKDGVKLASKLGFTFPKMAPHNLNEILTQPTWPAALSDFVTWCLMWDPKNRPNASQALAHEYFRDAVDPLRRPKSSSKLLGKKNSSTAMVESSRETSEPTLGVSGKSSSWFRRSIIQREISAPAVTQHAPAVQAAAQSLPLQRAPMDPVPTLKPRPNANKRATWTHGLASGNAPALMLPSIRPVSPISNTVNAQAQKSQVHDSASSKLANPSRTLHPDTMDFEFTASSYGALASPTENTRESFFSRVSKRARRFSGRYPLSPTDEVHSNTSSSHNRHSQVVLPSTSEEVHKQLQAPRPSWELPPISVDMPTANTANSHEHNLKRRHPAAGATKNTAPARSHKAQSKILQHNSAYNAPDEADELLSPAPHTTSKATSQYEWSANEKTAVNHLTSERTIPGQYLITPSASSSGPSASFNAYESNGKHLEVRYPTQTPHQSTWPTPPYDTTEREENWDAMHNWAMSTLDSVFSTGNLLSTSSQL